MIQLHTCTLSVTDDEVRWAFSPARLSSRIALDTETDGVGTDAMVIGIAIGTNRDCQCGAGHYWGTYIPIGHNTDEPQASLKLVRQLFKQWLADIDPAALRLYNKPFDRRVIQNTFGFTFPWHPDSPDVFHMAYLSDENLPDHKLKSLGERYFGGAVRDAERALDTFIVDKDATGHQDVPPSVEAPYAAQDVRLTLALDERYAEIIQRENLGMVLELETALAPILAEMEERGVLVDVAYMAAQEKEAREQMAAHEATFKQMAGRDDINLGSPDQLAKLLFEDWKLPVHKRTPKGAPSTDKFAMERLAAEGPEEYRPAIAALREHAYLATMVETFFVGLQDKAGADGIVHTAFRQMVRTGRMASSRPNLQNMPSKTHDGKPEIRVRSGFKVRPGKVWLMVDYAQIELRILAWYSGARRMKQAYVDGEDLHQQTADLLKIERKIAKNVNFAQVYGAGIAQLARTANTTEAEAKALKSRYMDVYPEIKAFSKAAERKAEERGFVFTVSGRRRRFEGRDRDEAKFWRAGNAIIQGSAADVMKQGLVNAWRAIEPYRLKDQAAVVLSIHDELVFEVDAGLEGAIYDLVRPAMLSAFVPPIDIPLDCDAKVATEDWGHAEEFPPK